MKQTVYILAFILCSTFFVALHKIGLLDSNVDLIVSLFLILILGIPHGAIDHLLFNHNKKTGSWKFYSLYLLTMLFFLVIWLIWPIIGLVSFLLISAYHFGQSQFIDVQIEPYTTSRPLYFSWGISILSGLLFYNQHEVTQILTTIPALEHFSVWLNSKAFTYTYIISFLIALTVLFYASYKGKLKQRRLISEILLYLFIHLVFLMLPVLLAFSLYFAFLHSTKVLFEEYEFLKSKSVVNGIGSFILSLLPFSLLSIFGMTLIVFILPPNILEYQGVLIILILISILTLPHSIIMEKFYSYFYSKS